MRAFRVDIMCIGHGRPCLTARRYYSHMSDVLKAFEVFEAREKETCPYHDVTSLIPRFYGPCDVAMATEEIKYA